MKPLRERKCKLECERELLIRGHETAKKTLQPLWRAVRVCVWSVRSLLSSWDINNTRTSTGTKVGYTEYDQKSGQVRH